MNNNESPFGSGETIPGIPRGYEDRVEEVVANPHTPRSGEMVGRHGFTLSREELEAMLSAIGAGIAACEAVEKTWGSTPTYKETEKKLQKQWEFILAVLGVK